MNDPIDVVLFITAVALCLRIASMVTRRRR
jgi:hypothetical protein